ncbi:MAG TPA: hypothetical protein PK335_14645 [Draconibacterium sp.]|nr:hypothetical protein [Draconibacterium sp.]
MFTFVAPKKMNGGMAGKELKEERGHHEIKSIVNAGNNELESGKGLLVFLREKVL